MITLRGIARRPPIPPIEEVYGLRAAAIAVYPMYRGLARLVGMTILPAGSSWAEQIEALRRHWDDYDFFFLHYKYTDAAGEDGDFARKVAVHRGARRRDRRAIVELGPDVLIVTGDHSTPASLRSHSWHPVPVLLAASTCRPDAATSSASGRACAAASGRSRRSTCCRSRWPTPAGSASTAPERRGADRQAPASWGRPDSLDFPQNHCPNVRGKLTTQQLRERRLSCIQL